MSEKLDKLAEEIDGLVSGFLSNAQGMGAAPLEAEKDVGQATLMVKFAIIALLKKNEPAILNKWNEILNKLPDEDYDNALRARRLDVNVSAPLIGSSYKVTMAPQVEEPRDVGKKSKAVIERYLQPAFIALAGTATAVANAVRRKHKNAGPVEPFMHRPYLIFK